ncbi:probable receptor-like protein kinase At2g23200 [Herrania umbratica]|uniref:Probable receptor-like protein kinase At2g23200 n=1 Tax=Herrania umbratica TaxID=108875 RepID=A0A6J0ZI03_9ROSI|nr:probable receptor-like protein kinase At2g23200 [Herrania umbratica]
MEKFHWDKLHEPLSLFLFLVLFLSYQLPSSAYTLPDKYFVNCGSKNNINVTSRTFVGDLNSDSVSFTKKSSSVRDNSQASGTPSLYQTARIFWQRSSYEFEINTNGTYLVRLHFFNSSGLPAAVFDVLASGFILLHNFTVQNSSSFPLIEEFILSIPIGKFFIYFVPQGSSFAFVNAIEVFPAPPNFIYDKAPQISQGSSSNEYNGILSRALKTIHRINVGGQTLTPENDTLFRTWLPDDNYLYNPDTAKNSQFYVGRPNYIDLVNEFIAPDLVYKTAKEMNINTSRPSNNFNITWSYDVTGNAKNLIRVHFCDIVSQSQNGLRFFLYINSNLVQIINPYETVRLLATPFFIDFVVDSDDSGLMNISIGPDTSLTQSRTAFLNGVEIMEMMRETDLVPITNESNQKPIFIIVGSVLGGLVLVCILGGVLFMVLKRRKPKAVETSNWTPLNAYRGSTHGDGKMPQLSTLSTEGTVIASPVPNLNLGLKIPFVEIQLATNNFDKKLQVGKGGFGNVYRGTLRDGVKVAVKRSKPGSGQGLPEFQTEIMVLSKIRHRHLVSLIGYCDEGLEMILVYEFMEKGTLRDHLYNSKLPFLSWKQRLEICIGAARGLHYLHKGASGGIIHRDVKSTNILLDENLVAKVADFGLSKSGPPGQTHVSTVVKGTFGYLDPEYFRTQQLTEKSDVYSFGVVLLEVICARPAINPTLPGEQVNLAEWAMFCKQKGLLEQIVDPSIKVQINPNSLKKFAEIAEKCLREDGDDRPTMGDVVWDLEYALQLQQTAVAQEPHEDSTSNASSILPFPILQRFPSMSAGLGRDDMSITMEDDSDSVPSASEVFSQLKINDAR